MLEGENQGLLMNCLWLAPMTLLKIGVLQSEVGKIDGEPSPLPGVHHLSAPA